MLPAQLGHGAGLRWRWTMMMMMMMMMMMITTATATTTTTTTTSTSAVTHIDASFGVHEAEKQRRVERVEWLFGEATGAETTAVSVALCRCSLRTQTSEF